MSYKARFLQATHAGPACPAHRAHDEKTRFAKDQRNWLLQQHECRSDEYWLTPAAFSDTRLLLYIDMDSALSFSNEIISFLLSHVLLTNTLECNTTHPLTLLHLSFPLAPASSAQRSISWTDPQRLYRSLWLKNTLASVPSFVFYSR